jgi:signal transduction histidine kinase
MYQEPYQLERMIQIFLHDLRSPLGVAQGYMHLLGGTQLPDDARPRAVQGVNDALNRMAKMVDDVSTLMDTTGASHPGAVKASRLCDRIRAVSESRGVAVSCPEACPDVLVRVGPSLDQLSESLMVLLHLGEAGTQRTAAGPISLTITIDQNVVHFSTCPTPDHGAATGELVPFDPWQTGKLDYLVAFRRLSFLQGSLWSKVGESRACGVTLPVEVVPE